MLLKQFSDLPLFRFGFWSRGKELGETFNLELRQFFIKINTL